MIFIGLPCLVSNASIQCFVIKVIHAFALEHQKYCDFHANRIESLAIQSQFFF